MFSQASSFTFSSQWAYIPARSFGVWFKLHNCAPEGYGPVGIHHLCTSDWCFWGRSKMRIPVIP